MVIVIILLMAVWIVIRYEPVTPSEDADIVVYTNTTCRCYQPWVRALKRASLAVGVVLTSSVANTQSELGVPREFAACHTASADGYWIEGHVPAASITTLLMEQPHNIGGLAQLRAEQQTGDRLQWEVVAYDNDGRPILSETQVGPTQESDDQVRHDP